MMFRDKTDHEMMRTYNRIGFFICVAFLAGCAVLLSGCQSQPLGEGLWLGVQEMEKR